MFNFPFPESSANFVENSCLPVNCSSWNKNTDIDDAAARIVELLDNVSNSSMGPIIFNHSNESIDVNNPGQSLLLEAVIKAGGFSSIRSCKEEKTKRLLSPSSLTSLTADKRMKYELSESGEVSITQKTVAEVNKERFHDFLNYLIEKYESTQCVIDIKDLEQFKLAITRLSLQKLLKEVSVEQSLLLFPHLDQQVKNGLVSKLELHDLQTLELALESTIILLNYMIVKDIDRRFLNEEIIENIINLFNHTLDKFLFPAIDPSQAAKGDKVEKQKKEFTDEDSSSLDSLDPADKDIKTKKKPIKRKMAKSLVNGVFAFFSKQLNLMDNLNQLIQVVALDDRLVLQLSSGALSTFTLESNPSSLLIQKHAMNLLCSIFSKYIMHREIILEDVLGLFTQLSNHRRNFRTYKLKGSSGSIQTISCLIISLVQSTIKKGPIKQLNQENSKETFNYFFTEVAQTAAIFVSSLLRRCMIKSDDSDYRIVLQNFTDDLLIALESPEWPGAEHILQVLSSSLAKVIGARSQDSQYSFSALTILGNICVALRKCIKEVRLNPIERDEVVTKLVQEVQIERHQHECKSFPMKLFLLTYLRGFDTLERFANDAQQFFLARFFLDGEKDEGIETKILLQLELCQDKQKQFTHLNLDVIRKVYLNLMICDSKAKKAGIFAGFDRLLGHIMSLLSEGKATYRARVIKCLSAVIDVDPILMSDNKLKSAVQRCFLDEGISVRQVTVELVGKYMLEQSELINKYFDLVIERLMDKGVSVRKTVVKILRELLLQHPDHCLGPETMKKLVSRIGDRFEEDTVKSLVIATFEEVCFTSPSSMIVSAKEFYSNSMELPIGWKEVKDIPLSPSPHQPSKLQSSFLSPKGKRVDSLSEVWSIVTPEDKKEKLSQELSVLTSTMMIIGVVYQLQSKTSWLVDLIKRLLASQTASHNVKQTKSAIYIRCQLMVDCVLEQLLSIEEGHISKSLETSCGSDQLFACISTLQVFCEADPSLLTPHFQSLAVYLKGDNHVHPNLEAKILSKVAFMSELIVRTDIFSDHKVIFEAEKDLENLVYRAPPSVLLPCIRCMATIAELVSKDFSPLLSLLERFINYILKYQEMESFAKISETVNSSLQRAVFTAGLIFRYIKSESILKTSSHSCFKGCKVFDTLYGLLSSILDKSGSSQLIGKTVKGISFMIMRQPRILLNLQEDGYLENLLTESASEVKMETLSSLSGILVEEQMRQNAIFTREMQSKKEQVQGDLEAEASLIGSVMQLQLGNILALCSNKLVQIRKEAIVLIELILTQGLVNPLHCIPTLVALLTDEAVFIREAVYNHLVQLHEKFPGILNTPTIEGIKISYKFQVLTKGSAEAALGSKDYKDGEKWGYFGQLYKECFQKTVKRRYLFLQALVNMFTEKGRILSRVQAHENVAMSFECLNYLARIITLLPFAVQSEPLYIIYHANRLASLRLSSLLEDMKSKFVEAGIDPWRDFEASEALDLSVYPVESLPLLFHPIKMHQNDLQSLCLAALSLCILLKLKKYLKEQYLLDDHICQTFIPHEKLSLEHDKTTSKSEHSPEWKYILMEEFHSPPQYIDYWNVYKEMLQIFYDDQLTVDFSLKERTKVNKTKSKLKVSKLKEKEIKKSEYIKQSFKCIKSIRNISVNVFEKRIITLSSTNK